MALQHIDTRLWRANTFSANIHSARCRPGIWVGFGVPPKEGTPPALQGVAKLTFLAAITAGVLFAWQGIALHIQQFSVRQTPINPVASVASWVHNAWSATSLRPAEPDSAIERPSTTVPSEWSLSAGQLVNRWAPLIATASQRFRVPADWIRAVVRMESGGRTVSADNRPITSHAGAMGVMQLMPGTYREMRLQYGLGANPYNPHDNIFAGAAYLRQLYLKYGYPAMFAAYNDGPGHLEERLGSGNLLPAETRNYVSRIVTALGGGGGEAVQAKLARFTRPNGTPVWIRVADATSVRAALPGEYSPGVQSVITVGRLRQGVRESVADVQAMGVHGVSADALDSAATRLAGLISQRVDPDRDPAPATSERHSVRRRIAMIEPRGRLEDLYREGDAASGVIHLKPITHSAHTGG